jgi:N-acetylmuramoyl-L-alanine amidase
MRIAMSSGHSTKCQGAVGYINEVAEATRVVDAVAEKLRAAAVQVETFHDTTSTNSNDNLNKIVNWHNGRSRDLDISCHFNAYQTTSKPMGTEVLYVTQDTLADEVSEAIAYAGAFINRGPKYRSDLYFLNQTEMPAILIEVCFVDSQADVDLYHGHFDEICTAIAEAVGNVSIDEQPPEPPEPVEPPEYTEENRVVVTSDVTGDVTLIVNGTMIRGHENCEHVVDLTVELVGDVTLVINGEAFHNKPEEPPLEPPDSTGDLEPADNHRQIEATVFGGAADNEHSAYPPYDSSGHGAYLNDTDLYVALPFSFDPKLFPNHAPQVRVWAWGTEISAVGRVADKGPWLTDDGSYVHGADRPLAETCHAEGTPLPRGPNAGKVPSNAAGIDLSPALAGKIGIDGKGFVSWAFVDDEVS